MRVVEWVVVAVSAIGTGASVGVVAVCRTIRHNQRVALVKHVVDKVIDKPDVSGADVLKTLEGVVGTLEVGPPESEAPPQIRAVEAATQQARRMLPGRRSRSRQQPPNDNMDQSA
jgi:hypothetical protein